MVGHYAPHTSSSLLSVPGAGFEPAWMFPPSRGSTGFQNQRVYQFRHPGLFAKNNSFGPRAIGGRCLSGQRLAPSGRNLDSQEESVVRHSILGATDSKVVVEGSFGTATVTQTRITSRILRGEPFRSVPSSTVEQPLFLHPRRIRIRPLIPIAVHLWSNAPLVHARRVKRTAYLVDAILSKWLVS